MGREVRQLKKESKVWESRARSTPAGRNDGQQKITDVEFIKDGLRYIPRPALPCRKRHHLTKTKRPILNDQLRAIRRGSGQRGWTYDTGDEAFREGERVLDVDELLGLLPELTLDELASYQDDRYDQLRAA